MDTIYLSGASVSRFGKFLDTPLAELTRGVVDEALADAEIDGADVGFVTFGNAVSSLITGQAMIQGELALLDTPLAGLPMLNVENACASGSTAVHLAVMAVAAGRADTAVAVGAEKMSHPDKQRSFDALGSAIDVTATAPAGGASRSSVFMNLYAQEARRYMAETGAPLEALAESAVTAHLHGSLNPKAQYRQARTSQEILDSRLIDDPLTLLMCSPIGDGAAAVVVSRHKPAGDAIAISGFALNSGRRGEGGALVTRTTAEALGQAGHAPTDADVIELHDAASPATLVILEEMGVAEHGEAWKLALDGQLRYTGTRPVNTSGGLVSRGHPVGATGVAQLVELVDQLRGRAGERQVSNDPRIGLAQNAGGAVTIDDPYTPGVCTVTVLERV